MVESRGEQMKIPMPGHAVGNNEEAIKAALENQNKLDALV
jgi:hypothetical protein